MSSNDSRSFNSRGLQDHLGAATSSTSSRHAEVTELPAESGADDDDMEEYEPNSTEEDNDEMEEFFEQLLDAEEDDENDREFHDATEGHGQQSVVIENEVLDGETETEAAHYFAGDVNGRRQQILRLLASSQIGRLFLRSADDGDDTFGPYGLRPRRKRRLDPDRFPKVPSARGIELMRSGDFGTNEIVASNRTKSKHKLARRILDRELGMDGSSKLKANQKLMAQDMIPSSNADIIVHYDLPVYSGQFSVDGNFFFSCVKDFKVRMYDTSNPYGWRYYKTVSYPYGQWTLTDATLSPDNKYLAYTSIRPDVCLAPTDPNDHGDPYVLDLSDDGGQGRGGRRLRSRHESFGIWSIRFSGDGRELVAGTSADSIVVYDIESRRTVLEIPGHDDDVNAVCFGDVSSPHILYSGSDDTTLKVWDRRSMGDSREAGAFVGHTEGLTYIDSKGDGRYILSNGKDQSMKLWDLRMVMTTARFKEIDAQHYSTGFDYRWGAYNEEDWAPHPHDNSVVTFRGHKVLRTLIRCHFSPAGSTNSRYVYSGSEDGKVYVYNLDATLAGKIDVLAATKDSRPYDLGSMLDAYHYDDDDRQAKWRTCVRDAAWHPNAPVIAASSWNGYGMSYGSVTVHSWNDGAEDDEAEPKMGMRADDKLHCDPSLYELQPPRSRYVALGRGLRTRAADLE